MLTPSIKIDKCPLRVVDFWQIPHCRDQQDDKCPTKVKREGGGVGTLEIDRANTILHLKTIRVILY